MSVRQRKRTPPWVRVELVHERAPRYRPRLKGPYQVYGFLSQEASRWDREHFVALALDQRNRCEALHEVSVGSCTSAIVHPREVFKAMILANACSVILAHNHPSGDTSPSHEDREITQRLIKAGELLGIRVLDHLIVAGTGYYSFADSGLI